MDYIEFLKTKIYQHRPSGFVPSLLPSNLYGYQSDLVKWACQRGKAALFTMTGTGKTAMQVAWADQVAANGHVLIVAPLAVSRQTICEAWKFGIRVNLCRTQDDIKPGINVTNYEMLHHFEPSTLAGIVLDESSILKNQSGKMRKFITDFARNIPYRLCCTATPAPNDFMEIGTHAEFLGVMNYTEMLATFFVHDGGETSKWRLKGHAEESFWRWLASWAVFLTKPSDLGYPDDGFDLPPLYTKQHMVKSDAAEGCLFTLEATGLQERQAARRESIHQRAEKCVEIISESPKPFMVWCDLNAESSLIAKMMPGAIEVKGSDSDNHKEKSMLDFANGNIDLMISKPSICGFGMNFQACSNTAFLGLSDSFEAMFQATKRFHRHGQKKPVTRHIIISEAEGSVLQNVMRKEADFMRMIDNMVIHTRHLNIENVRKLQTEKIKYNPTQQIVIPTWV